MAAPDLAEALQVLLRDYKAAYTDRFIIEFEEKSEVINARAALKLAGILLPEPTIQD